jgi:hypothetical protein
MVYEIENAGKPQQRAVEPLMNERIEYELLQIKQRQVILPFFHLCDFSYVNKPIILCYGFINWLNIQLVVWLRTGNSGGLL